MAKILVFKTNNPPSNKPDIELKCYQELKEKTITRSEKRAKVKDYFHTPTDQIFAT